MAPSTEQIDNLLEWRPGTPAAAHIQPWHAMLWGARRAGRAKLLIATLWLAQALLLQRAGVGVLEAMRGSSSWAEVYRQLGASTSAFPSSSAGASTLLLDSIGRTLWSPTPYFVLLYGLLAGGALAYLHAPRPTALMPQLGAGCGTYLGRFARILAIAAAASWLLQYASGSIFTAPGSSPWSRVLLWQGTSALLAAVFDYARVRTVVRDSRSMFLETARSARFFLRNLPRVLTLELAIFLLATLLGGLVVTASGGLRWLVSPVAARLITEQVFVVVFLWLRLVSWAAMLSLYQGIALRDLASESV